MRITYIPPCITQQQWSSSAAVEQHQQCARFLRMIEVRCVTVLLYDKAVTTCAVTTGPLFTPCRCFECGGSGQRASTFRTTFNTENNDYTGKYPIRLVVRSKMMVRLWWASPWVTCLSEHPPVFWDQAVFSPVSKVFTSAFLSLWEISLGVLEKR